MRNWRGATLLWMRPRSATPSTDAAGDDLADLTTGVAFHDVEYFAPAHGGGVLIRAIGGIDRAAGDDRGEYAVGNLVDRLLKAGRIAPLPRIANPVPHRWYEQPGTRDHRRQRLELARLLGVQRPQRLVDRLRCSAVELSEDGGDSTEGIGAGVDCTGKPGVEIWLCGCGGVVARGGDEHVGDGPQSAHLSA